MFRVFIYALTFMLCLGKLFGGVSYSWWIALSPLLAWWSLLLLLFIGVLALAIKEG